MNRPPNAAALRAEFGRPSDVIIRNAIVEARRIAAHIRGFSTPDPTLQTRAATAPAMTGATGWADTLATSSVADLVVGDAVLGAPFGSRELFRRALQLSFGRSNAISVPTMVITPTGRSPFFREGKPFPVRQLAFMGPPMERHKVGVGISMTFEMYDTPNAMTYTRAGVEEGLAADLDAVTFGEQAGVPDLQPPGLRHGVPGLTPSAGGVEQAMDADIAALVNAVSPIARTRIALCVSLDLYHSVTTRRGGPPPYPIIATSGLPDKTVMAVALPALAVAFGDSPGFRVADDVTLHMDDTNPVNIGTPGSPAVVAAPSVGTLQTDSIALRLILDLSWTLRAANAVAWVENVTW
ncbi:hypothetical protein [Bradyrhizobium lablabi]|uniref:hypothetical protein n=1 Tax=Bradyrhizobium lablabi TaxID=722472 RepID=UPI001BA80375|nr:hypothetical protein [Bradyrhizobium lablabi]MBR0695141.1 hypothetical protein [Bradyrhizobium lablabi]